MPQLEIKKCQNCGDNFAIEPEDFEFYQKIEVPEPTWCPECRRQRRLVLRNERILYRRTCDLCKKQIISIYSSDKPYPVYCSDCFFGDKWDQYQFNHEIDFKRSFFEQYQELQNKAPRLALFNMEAVNSKFLNYADNNKDCYLCFRIANSEDCHYCYYLLTAQNCLDCSYLRKGELLYNCFECRDSYNCRSLVEARACHDCAYSYDLRNCSYCLFSWNLRNKKYQIENKSVSKEEFERVWQEYLSGSRIKTREAEKRFNEIYKDKAIHKYNKIVNSNNVQGINITNSRNLYNIYNGNDSENVRYGEDMEKIKDGMDVKGPMQSELLYEVCSIDFGCYRIFFSNFAEKGCRDIYYSSHLFNSRDCFGCISLKNAQNCIFNKKYPEKEYQELKDKLIAHMKEVGEFGENLPIEISPFAYNETMALEQFPLTKEHALKRGYAWQDNLPGIYGKETLKQKDIPDNIKQVKDDIAQAIIVCHQCGRNYQITKPELKLYRKLLIPIPENCPDCRYLEKEKNYKMLNQLLERRCTCQESEHEHHRSGRCSNEFETPYSEKSGLKNIWCEECYKYLL